MRKVDVLGGLRALLRTKVLTVLAIIEIVMLLFVNTFYQILFFPRLTSLGVEIGFLGVLDVTMLCLSSMMLLMLPRLTTRDPKLNVTASTIAAAIAFTMFCLSSSLSAALILGVSFDLLWTARKHVLPVLSNQYLSPHDRAIGLSSLSFVGNFGAALLMPVVGSLLVLYSWAPVAPLVFLFMLLGLLHRHGKGLAP